MTRLRMNFGTEGPGTKNFGGDLLPWRFFLNANVTLTMKQATLLSNTTMTATWERIPAYSRPLIFGFERMVKSSFAVALVLSEADRRFFSFWCRSVPRITSVMSLGNSWIDICFVYPWELIQWGQWPAYSAILGSFESTHCLRQLKLALWQLKSNPLGRVRIPHGA